MDTNKRMDELRLRIQSDPRLKERAIFRDRLASLGDAFRKARLERDLSQKQVADLAGVDQADISRLENGEGKQGPTLETIVKCAHALGADFVMGLVPQSDDKDGQYPMANRKRDPMLIREPNPDVAPFPGKIWVTM